MTDASTTDASTPRTLVLLRHAKSSWREDLPDHERPLNGRGRRDAYAVGEALLADGLTPDLVYCSAAVRTRQTWERVAEAGVRAGEVTYTERIYDASRDALAEVVAGTPAAVRTLLLVGHAPGVPALADFLAGPGSEPQALSRMQSEYPTSAIAVFAVVGDWSGADRDHARLLRFEVPRG
ncbi:MAG: SixA phosphatase family protein [Actinomycetes bacterium]